MEEPGKLTLMTILVHKQNKMGYSTKANTPLMLRASFLNLMIRCYEVESEKAWWQSGCCGKPEVSWVHLTLTFHFPLFLLITSKFLCYLSFCLNFVVLFSCLQHKI